MSMSIIQVRAARAPQKVNDATDKVIQLTTLGGGGEGGGGGIKEADMFN